MDFLWNGLSWLFPRFWLVGYPSFVINFLNSPKFSWRFSH